LTRLSKRAKAIFWDFLIAGILGASAFNRGVPAILVAVIAFILYLILRSSFRDSMPEVSSAGNEFVVVGKPFELDVNFDRRPTVNHFRTTDGDYTADYEYRIDGTSVFCRLIEDWHGGPGVSEYKDVRDGVVLESAIRARNSPTPRDYFHGFNVGDEIDQVRREVEWHEMGPVFRERCEYLRLRIGLKYLILAKKLPQPDARRYLRQELERLQTGAAAFFKEAEKYGLERDDNSRLIDRLRVAEGETHPPYTEIQGLFASIENLGMTDLEFSWERKLTRVLEKLLADLPV
jgi:hypothetical protein